MKYLHPILLVCLSLSLFHCNEKLNDSPLANRQPRSFLWLYPDSTVGIGVSRQHLRWWGEDPDGTIRGYLFGFVPERLSATPSPDTIRYTWVSKNDTVMQFPLDTLFRYFTVFVRAVDNTFPGLPEKSSVRLGASPYVDMNVNGVFDAGDRALASLPGAMDPVGANLAFPIRNSPPTIAFARNPNDPGNVLRLPDTTYTVVSIGFKGADADGENNLKEYRIALNDTSSSANWLTLRLRDTVVTLVVPRARSNAAPNIPGAEVAADVYGGKFLGRQLIGQLPGLRLDASNTVYVQVKDVAGEFSPAIKLPSGTMRWVVKRPRGKVLLVGDYTRNDATTALSSYLNALRAVPDSQFATIDFLNIALGVNATDKEAGRLSVNIPPYIDPAVINTFLLYDFVILYSDEAPSLGVLQAVPFLYLQNGGKMLVSTVFPRDFSRFNATAVLREFAPIDSVFSGALPAPAPPVPGATRVPANRRLFPDSTVPSNIYPRLAFDASTPNHIFFMREIYKRTDARVLYRLEEDPLRAYKSADPSGGADTLRPKMAVVDGQRTIVFFGVPVHLLNNTTSGNDGLLPLFAKMFTQQFSQRQKVDRRKF